jgi:hypothetical protein
LVLIDVRLEAVIELLGAARLGLGFGITAEVKLTFSQIPILL